jgi:8-oxo-dGTP pyrophosphatase MutT (NUDIX family)
MSHSDQQHWERVRTEQGPHLKLFQVRYDWLKNPRNGHAVEAVILEAPDWVNVVALTPQDNILVVHQYRFGTGSVTTEIPAGIIEAGESSQAAAARELREETGYTTDDWEYLGYVEPNSAFLDNRCHHWLARDVQQTLKPQLDAGEHVSVAELSLEELRQEIAEKRMRHSLAIAALSHVFDLRKSSE